MSKPQNYADILLNLPVDETLKTFLERHVLPLPEGWSWSDSMHTSRSLVRLVQSHPNTAMRDRIVAGLHASTLLAHPLGNLRQHRLCNDKYLIGLRHRNVEFRHGAVKLIVTLLAVNEAISVWIFFAPCCQALPKGGGALAGAMRADVACFCDYGYKPISFIHCQH